MDLFISHSKPSYVDKLGVNLLCSFSDQQQRQQRRSDQEASRGPSVRQRKHSADKRDSELATLRRQHDVMIRASTEFRQELEESARNLRREKKC